MPDTDTIVLLPTSIKAPVVKLREGPNVVGRDPTCSLVLSDFSVSRFHAEILLHGARITVRDLKSRNGTYVDGRRVQSADVRPGQHVKFGCVQLTIARSATDAAASEAELETQSISDVFESLPINSGKAPLSAAERRVFNLILAGLSEKEVARRLDISPNTVHCHVRKIYEVLGVRSRAELMARFIQLPNGQLSLTEKTKTTAPRR
jgi:DNA-binding CsgD family transcriptional regulator